MLLTITNIDINRQGLLILDLFFLKKKRIFYVCLFNIGYGNSFLTC